MSFYIDNFCVGCPQGCINCGRNKDVKVWVCDRCDEPFYNEDEIISINGQDYCQVCYDDMNF